MFNYLLLFYRRCFDVLMLKFLLIKLSVRTK